MVKPRSVLVCLLLFGGAAHAEMYRSVDADGNVVYSDRPVQAGQKPEPRKAPNVASPEASRQIEEEKAELIKRRNEEARRNDKRPVYIQHSKPPARAQ